MFNTQNSLTNKKMRIIYFITFFAVLALAISGCAQNPAKPNDYFNTLEKSKKSLDELKRINEEAKSKADAYEKEQKEAAGEIKTEKNAKVFFSNSHKDPNMLDCGSVYPVERPIDLSGRFDEETVKRNLEALFAGPTDEEKKNGYFTSLNADVKINQVFIYESSLKVDFDQKLEEGAAGSCKVSAIRAQLENTMKQYDKNVVISVDGRTDDILQP
jgi:hypothetical protein